jgi:hypothetical protein
MANTDFLQGFKPVRMQNGGPIPQHRYDVDASATVIYPGDVLTMDTDGYVVEAAATQVNLIGVAAEYHAGSTAGSINVYDDPYTIFEAQVNGGTLDQAAVGACADLDASASADTTRLVSTHQLSSTVGSGSAQFKILRLANREGTYKHAKNALGANMLVECIFNEHLLKQTAGI